MRRDLPVKRMWPATVVVCLFLLWGAGVGQADWKSEWEQLLAGAKREGRVTVAGPPQAGHREAILKFQEAFPDIRIEYSGLVPVQLDTRIGQERQVGSYLWDVSISGVTSVVLKKQIMEGWYDSLKPALILPEVLDDSKWLGGFDAGFMDKDKKYGYAFVLNVARNLYVNRDFIPAPVLQTPHQLLDSRWKGKIAWYDPRVTGAGSLSVAKFRILLGDPATRRLLVDQEPAISQDARQLGDWLVRGRYPIVIGTLDLPRFQKEGLGLNVDRLRLPVENVTPATGAVRLLNQAPNPNSARVFLNWLLGKEVQARWAKLGLHNSRRLDVPPGDPEAVPDPKKLDQYLNFSKEEHAELWADAMRFARELLK